MQSFTIGYGSSATASFCVNNSFELVYQSDTWQSEISHNLVDDNGSSVSSSSAGFFSSKSSGYVVYADVCGP